MKTEIAFYMRRVGPALMVIGMAILAALSLSFPFPGAWNAYMALPDQPLRGFWIAWGVFGVLILGFSMWLFSLGMEDRR